MLEEVRITILEILNNRMVYELIEARAFRLLGVTWKEYIEYYYDDINLEFVIRYH